MKVIKMLYFRQLEYFFGYFLTRSIHIQRPRQIVVNYYSQHSMVLYLFGDVALLRSEGRDKTLYVAIFSFLVVISTNFVLSEFRTIVLFQSNQSNCQDNFAVRHGECLSLCLDRAKRYRLQEIHIILLYIMVSH